MNITVTGTVLDIYTDSTSLFSMQFDVSGGHLVTAGCDSALMGVQVTDFSAQISYQPVASPQDFSAFITETPYPCGGEVFGAMVGGPLSLWSDGPMFANGSTLHGSLGGYEIQTAVWHDPPVSMSEPGLFPLTMVGLSMAALIARFRRFEYEG